MEIIGRFIMMTALMSAALVAGAICALCVYLILRLKKRRCRRAYLFAGLFPPATMAFWLACLIMSSALSGWIGTPDLVFGDINEALPNGYRLKALDKMPESGTIEKSADLVHGVGWVRSLEVQGPYVFGKYDYTFFPRTTEEVGRNYFLFDTRTGRTTNFVTEDQLAIAVNTKVHLTPNESFRGPKSTMQEISTAIFLILTVGSPLAVGFWILLRLAALLQPVENPLAGSN